MKKRLTIILFLCIFCCTPSKIKPLPAGISLSIALATTYAIRLILELHNGNCEITLNTIVNLGSNDCQFVIHLASEILKSYRHYNDSITWTLEDIQSYMKLVSTCSHTIVTLLKNTFGRTAVYLR